MLFIPAKLSNQEKAHEPPCGSRADAAYRAGQAKKASTVIRKCSRVREEAKFDGRKASTNERRRAKLDEGFGIARRNAAIKKKSRQ